jgi:nicotinamide mononucleotide (NMN) deamidase PncC
VGLTWIALSARDHEEARSFVWDGDRAENKASSAEAVLEMVREFLEGL